MPGVRSSEIWALPEPEVRIAVDLERMGRAGVSLGQIEAAVRGENATIPGGAVDVGLRKFNLKTSGSYDSLDEIADTVVSSRNGRWCGSRRRRGAVGRRPSSSTSAAYNGERAIFVTASAKDRVDVFAVRNGDRRPPRRLRAPRCRRTCGSNAASTRRATWRTGSTRLGLDFAIAIASCCVTLLPLGLRAAAS